MITHRKVNNCIQYTQNILTKKCLRRVAQALSLFLQGQTL